MWEVLRYQQNWEVSSLVEKKVQSLLHYKVIEFKRITLEIDTLNVLETYTADSIRKIHKILTEKLFELYISYDKKDFISIRTMQRHMVKTKLNDYHVYKRENSLIKLYKYKNKNKEATLQEI